MVRRGDCKYRAVWGNMPADSGEQRFSMDFDLVLRDVRLADAKADQPATDIGVKDGRIAAIAPQLGGGAAEQVQGGGRLVSAGFVETHIHLDKSASWRAATARPSASRISPWSGSRPSSTLSRSRT